jgi:hypothetical protein
MMKSFEKYFLTICVVLLSGVGSLFANVGLEGTLQVSARSIDSFQVSDQDDSGRESVHFISGSSTPKDKNADVDVFEYQEEEELVSSKKNQIKKKIATNLLHELATGYFLHQFNKVALHQQPVSDASFPERFITLCVFRI